MNILQSIFTDYYEHIIYKLHPRPAVIENVDKMIHCGVPLLLPPALINMMVNLLLFTTHGTKITKPSKNAFPPRTSSNASSSISPKNISRCCVTMVSMPSTISRRKSSADVFLLKSGNFYQVYRIGVLPFFFLSGMTLYAVLIVVPPCRFWKFTTKNALFERYRKVMGYG